MSTGRLAIIGANASISKLINRANEMGYETHVFAWKSGDPGERLASVFHPVSIEKKEEILRICREIKPVGITSITSDFAYECVNYVARNLNLVANEQKSEIVARNKFEMRRAFKASGIPTPFFVKLAPNDIPDAQHFSYPLIVKPVDGWSSKGVSRVDSPDELNAAIDYARKQSRSGDVILESFIEGPEYSAECLSFRGIHNVIAFTEKRTTGYPHYVETGHKQPASLSSSLQELIKKTVYKALDALGIRNGASHAEFRVTSNGEVFLIEVGARMGGDCIGTDLVPLSTGVDYIADVIRVACGDQPILNKKSMPGNAEVRFFLDKDDELHFQEYAGRENLEIHEYVVEEGSGAANVTNSSERYGHCVFTLK